jgi:hypothetical protein
VQALGDRSPESIATTSLYLLTLTSEENPDAEVIEQAIGVDER